MWWIIGYIAFVAVMFGLGHVLIKLGGKSEAVNEMLHKDEPSINDNQ